jgi:Bax protein
LLLLPVLVVAVVATALWLGAPDPGRRDVADLPERQGGAERKHLFFDFLRPVVRAENRRVQASRERLLALLEHLDRGGEVGAWDADWLARMARRYRVDASAPRARAEALKRKIDRIPTSLALAQAALESAWGQSRFAREANNLFGEWCFTPGCGVVPKARPAGRTYEVAAFDGVGASVHSYIRNLNSHPAYAPLRRLRAQARSAGREPTGHALAGGLYNYAEIGMKYVGRIQSVIQRNDLDAAAPE